MDACLVSSPGVLPHARAGWKPALRMEGGLSLKQPSGFLSFNSGDGIPPPSPYFWIAVWCYSHEVANWLQHVVEIRGRGSVLGSRVDQLLQVDMITGKCIKRAGVGK